MTYPTVHETRRGSAHAPLTDLRPSPRDAARMRRSARRARAGFTTGPRA
jgi:hypothetical protein